jgi:hypothetical protein
MHFFLSFFRVIHHDLIISRRDTQENSTASLNSWLENLVKKFGDPELCPEIFVENSSRCPDLVRLTARLLVKSLSNNNATNALSSLGLAVQGLAILTRNGKGRTRREKDRGINFTAFPKKKKKKKEENRG